MQVESFHYAFNEDVQKHEPTKQSRPRLDQCIENIVRQQGYKNCDVVKKAIYSNGGGYLGDLYEIDVTGTTEDGEKETNIFVKSMAPDAIDLEIISLEDIYNQELFFYKELSKIFEKVQNDAQIPEGDRFKTVKSYEESYPEAIILENVCKRGFKTWYRMDVITIDMAEICVKQLARFHGLSFAMEHKTPEYFEKKIKSIAVPFVFVKTWEAFITKYSNVAVDSLDEDLKRKVGHKIPGLLKKYSQYFGDETSRYCLCHGDYRPNNVMVKEVDGIVTEALPVDYQIIHYGCPIFDFLYFMYTGTDYKFRQAHISNLKDLYFETLRTYLQHFNISIDSVFPRKVFEDMYKQKLDYGLMVTVLFGPFIFAAEGNVPDLSKERLPDVGVTVDDRFKDRLTGAVGEFIELGYL